MAGFFDINDPGGINKILNRDPLDPLGLNQSTNQLLNGSNPLQGKLPTTLQQSLNNLSASVNPADQLNGDLNSLLDNPMDIPGLVADDLLRKRQQQLDPRDQEWQDIQLYLNNPLK